MEEGGFPVLFNILSNSGFHTRAGGGGLRKGIVRIGGGGSLEEKKKKRGKEKGKKIYKS